MTASSPSINRSPSPAFLSEPGARHTESPAAARYIGRYEVLGELASGGTGTVYLARLNALAATDQLYALKVLHKHLSCQPEIVAMLRKEAHLAAQVRHPHVVDMIEASATEDGQHYLVMGYVEGASLDDLFAHPKLDAIRRVRLGIPILLDAMSGLDAVHRATDEETGEPLGIVHRDMSPANILIGLDGVGRIADFGIASARTHRSISEPGVVRGTPRYMPPEQATGAGPITPRSDVFGLGTVLWEVITGEPLFDSHVSVEDILQQVVSATIPPPSDRNSRMPEALDAVCLRALQRDPARRYGSVAELRDELAHVADGHGLIATPRELVQELASLFGERVEQRRALVAQAARRRSGTQLRAVVVSDGKVVTDQDDDDEPTLVGVVGSPAELLARKSIAHTQVGIRPLRDAALDAIARDGVRRSHITSTRIGLDPVKLAATPEAPTLDDLLGRDEEEEEKVELASASVAALPPMHNWRRWAALTLALTVVAVTWLGYATLRGSVHAPAAVPTVPPAKLVAPAQTVAPVATPSTASLTAIPPAAVQRPVAPPSLQPAPRVAPAAAEPAAAPFAKNAAATAKNVAATTEPRVAVSKPATPKPAAEKRVRVRAPARPAASAAPAPNSLARRVEPSSAAEPSSAIPLEPNPYRPHE